PLQNKVLTPPTSKVFTHFSTKPKQSRISERMVKKNSSRDIEAMPPCISIGILAWNEAEAIGATLHSLFRQSLFAELNQRQLNCEILCVANGCTDQTAAIAEAAFAEQKRAHAFNQAFRCRARNLPARGKNNAWNVFVHTFSAREAQ